VTDGNRKLLATALFIFILLALAPLGADAEIPAEIAAAYSSVRGGDMIEFVRIIASDKFKGRASGSEQNYQTALMLALAMQESGMKPAGEPDSFLQDFPIEDNVIEGPFAFELIKDGTQVFMPKHGKDFVFRGFTGSGDVYSRTFFAGYGVSLPDYDSYAGVDVNGSVVVVLNGLPPEYDTDKNWDKKLAGFKMQLAANHGAKGIIFIGDVDDNFNPPIASVYKGDYPYQHNLPAVKVNSRVANALSNGLDYPLSTIKRMIDENGEPMSFPLEVDARIQVNTRYDPTATAWNVIGNLKGRHSSLRNRYIIVCAHIDHLGYQGGLIFNGAEDNASGVSVLNALIRAFALLDKMPRRSILIVGFSGEEKGLLGSKYFVEHPPVPLNRIDAVINLDMVGQGNFLTVFGGMKNPLIYSAFAVNANEAGIKVTPSNNMPPSDQKPFAEAGVPSVMLLTIGEHVGYHTAADDVENLSPKLLEDVAQLTLLSAWQLAEY